ncbi:hypothetical protein SAMN05421858_2865 [Haladaptatus litoreus]|uniref:DUF378 domain-containing protein n=1 Tax=Haladaptatus litoreus TaxID=553468 RepID=A0A1N7C038_9EURY|nr:DUF378 domain-containing protein [Haladaptatus litoreus]SIR56824.1 hypothetical protein SAMN05421858_2865 [Haladaptatus litoreus]
MATDSTVRASGAMETNGLDWFSILLVVIGALNWGIVGITSLIGGQVNVVRQGMGMLFLPDVAQILTNLVYVLVGLAGLYFIYTSYKIRRASRQTTRQPVQQTE